MNITVHHEIPVQSILLIVRVVGVYVFEFIATVALCAALVGILLRWLDSHLGRQIVQMGLDLDDENDDRLDAYYRGLAGDHPRDPRIKTVANGSVTEKN